VSLLLLLWFQPEFTVVLLIWITATYLICIRIPQLNGNPRVRVMAYFMLVSLGILLLSKYAPGLYQSIYTLSAIGFGKHGYEDILVPIGVSYFAFRFMHVIADAYRGQLARYGFVEFCSYCLFFPIILAGPIERIQHFMENRESRFSWSSSAAGIERIGLGLAKKLFLVNFLLIGLVDRSVVDAFSVSPEESVSLVRLWLFLLLSFLIAYLDFSAYSDIAIGTSRLFGFRIAENFRFPIFRRNLSEFWQCWHISLSSWCRDYVFLPVFASTRNLYVALFASMISIGLWHDISVNWLIWGALHAAGLSILKRWGGLYQRTGLGRGPVGHALGVVFTVLFVSWVFAFVAIPEFDTALRVFLYAASGFKL
ncbi:MAG: MBOAT family O-acyltransferase, partial [Pseudomonadota bacterium]